MNIKDLTKEKKTQFKSSSQNNQKSPPTLILNFNIKKTDFLKKNSNIFFLNSITANYYIIVIKIVLLLIYVLSFKMYLLIGEKMKSWYFYRSNVFDGFMLFSGDIWMLRNWEYLNWKVLGIQINKKSTIHQKYKVELKTKKLI